MTDDGQDRQRSQGDRNEQPDPDQPDWGAQRVQGGSTSAWGAEQGQQAPSWGAPPQGQQQWGQAGWGQNGAPQQPGWTAADRPDQGRQPGWGGDQGQPGQGQPGWGAAADRPDQGQQPGWGAAADRPDQGQQPGWDDDQGRQPGWGDDRPAQGQPGWGVERPDQGQQAGWNQGGYDQGQQAGWSAGGGSSSAWGSPGEGQQGGWAPPPGQGVQGQWSQQQGYGYSAPPPAKSRIWIIVAVALAVAAALGFAVFTLGRSGGDTVADGGTGGAAQPLTGGQTVDVTELSVGTCMQDPLAGATEGQVSEITTTSCTEPHDEEVFAVYDLPGGETDEFPGDQQVIDQANQGCVDRFEGYVGSDYPSSALTISTIYPTVFTWATGDREVVCLAYRTDEADLTAPIAGSGL